MYLAADLLVLTVRAASFVALFQAVGACLFLALFGNVLSSARSRVCSLAKWSALAGVGLTLLHYALLPVRMAGSFSAMFDGSLDAVVAHSNVESAHVFRFAGLALLGASLDTESLFHRATRLLGAGLALISFPLMGHTTIHELRPLLVVLLLLHVSAAAFWFGSLAPLRIVSYRETPARRQQIVEGFSSYAVRAVPVLLLSGALMAGTLLGTPGELLTPYGRMLCLKTLLFAVLLWLASLNRARLVPAMAVGDAQSLNRFRSVVATEWVLLVIVIVATALMTGLFAPESLHGSFSDGHEVDAH